MSAFAMRLPSGTTTRRLLCALAIGASCLLFDAAGVAQEPRQNETQTRRPLAAESRARRSRVIMIVGLGTAATFTLLALSGWLTPGTPDD